MKALLVVMLIGCGAARTPAVQAPSEAVSSCDAYHASISRDADARAGSWSIAKHLAKHFPDRRIAWLMKEADYQRFVVKPAAKKWARCNDHGCHLFAAPEAAILAAVKQSMIDGHHDPVPLGRALGLPAASLEGPLRVMVLDVGKAGTCVRLPVATDPGATKECLGAEDRECFKFGGYTSGGVPEIMVIDAPVDRTAIEAVP